MGWWAIANGVTELAKTRHHLIALLDIALVIPQDGKIKKGGYATIRRVRIEGCLEISSF